MAGVGAFVNSECESNVDDFSGASEHLRTGTRPEEFVVVTVSSAKSLISIEKARYRLSSHGPRGFLLGRAREGCTNESE